MLFPHYGEAYITINTALELLTGAHVAKSLDILIQHAIYCNTSTKQFSIILIAKSPGRVESRCSSFRL